MPWVELKAVRACSTGAKVAFLEEQQEKEEDGIIRAEAEIWQ